MQTVNIDKNEKNANWLHVKKVMGKVKVDLNGEWYLGPTGRENIRKIVARASGEVDEGGVITGCTVFVWMIQEILELGGLIYYCSDRERMVISNWRNPIEE